MNHRVIIVAMSALVVAAIVGGVVYVEWPRQSAPQAQLVPQESPAVETVQEQATATSSLIESLPQPVVGPPEAEAQAGMASAIPTIIAVNEPTDVTVTISIIDSRLIPASVNLQRLDVSGKVVAVLGNLHDTGTNGDAVANDKTFTIRQSLTEATTIPVQLRVSWGLKGVVKRVVSNVATVEVWQRVMEPTSSASFVIPPNWSTETQGFLALLSSPTTTIARGDPEQLDLPPDIRIQVLLNPGNLNINDFALQFDNGWFGRYVSMSNFTVDGHDAITFSNLGPGVGRAPVLATFVTLPQDRVLLLTIPGYEGDLTPERIQVFEQIIELLKFN